MDGKVEQLLLNLVETARIDNFDMDKVFAKFPELQNADQQLLLNFVETARQDSFNMDLVFSKFPEITGEKRKEVEPGKQSGPAVLRGTPMAGSNEQASSGEEKKKDIFVASSSDEVPESVYVDTDFWDTPRGGEVNVQGDYINQHKWDRGALLAKYGGYDGIMNSNLDGRIKAQFKKEFEFRESVFETQQGQAEGERTSLEDIAGEKRGVIKEEKEIRSLGVDDPIDLRNMKTVVNKDAGAVRDAFDKSAEFPGLTIIETGILGGEAVRFVLPDGSEVQVNLYPGIKHLTIGGPEAYRKKVANEVAKLEKVKQWYEDNDGKADLGLFRLLGKREDMGMFSSDATRFDDLTSINRELGKIGMEISAPEIHGAYIGNHTLTSENGRNELISGTPSEIQGYLFNNITAAQKQILKTSVANATIEAVRAYTAKKSVTYAELSGNLESVVDSVIKKRDYKDKVSLVINGLEITSGDKESVKDWLREREMREEVRMSQSGSYTVKTKRFSDETEEYAHRYRVLMEAVSNGTLPDDLSVTDLKAVQEQLSFALQLRHGADEEDGAVYNDIIDREYLNSAIRVSSTRKADDWLSKMNSMVDEEGEATFINTAGEVVRFYPEAVSAGIDDIKKNKDYYAKLGKTNSEYLGIMNESYEKLFGAYEEKSKSILESNSREQDDLLAAIREEGLGYEVVNGRLVILGLDEKEVNKWQGQWNSMKESHEEEASLFHSGITALNSDFNEFAGDVLNVGNITQREYDFGDLMGKRFMDGVDSMVTGIPAFFGSKEALRQKASMAVGQEAYEAMYDYKTAYSEGLGWRFSALTVSSQAANVGVAIGTNLLLPGAGMWLAPALFGMSAGGDTRFSINQTVDTGKKATKALSTLEADYEKGLVSKAQYLNAKVGLEQTIALGDLDTWQIESAVLSAAIIEGGITYAIGTVPNARNAIRAIRGTGNDLVSAITTKNWKAGFNMLGKTGKELGREVLEEELIYFGNELSAGLLIGREMDFSQWDDIAVTAALTSGPMSGPSNLINTVRSQYVTQKLRTTYFEGKAKLEALRPSIEGMSSLEPNEQQAIRQEVADIVQKHFTNSTSEMELSAIINGVSGLETMVRSNSVLNEVGRKAGVEPQDDVATKKQKIDDYKKTLDKDGQQDVDNKIRVAQEQMSKIYSNTEFSFENDALGDNGTIAKHFGDRGLSIAKLLGEKDGKFNKLSNKDKLIAVHEQSKTDYQSETLAEMQSDADIKKDVERHVYGNKKGFSGAKLADGKTKRTRRKLKAEKQAYEAMAKNAISRRGEAAVTYSGQYTNAKKILSKKELANVVIQEFKTVEDIQEYTVDNWKSLDYKSIDEARSAAVDMVTGRGDLTFHGKLQKTIDADGKPGKMKYLVLDKESAMMKLKDGKLLQGTMFSHEVSHAIDELTMKKGEIKQLADNLFESLDNGSNAMKRVNILAIARMSDTMIDEKARLVLENPNKLYNPESNPALPMDKQSDLAAEEYVKAVQDVMQQRENIVALKQSRKFGQGMGNLFRSTIGGDFKFSSKGSALNYIVGYIDAFSKGEISRQSQRKINFGLKHPSMLTDKSASKESTDSQKQASDRVQQHWLNGDTNKILLEFDGKNPDTGKQESKSILESVLFKYKRVAGFNMDDAKIALATSERGVFGLIRDYNPIKNSSIAAYINTFLPSRAIEIVGEAGTTGQIDQDIDNMNQEFIDENDSVLETERKGKGVKLWERFGDEGNAIHMDIITDVLSGDIDVSKKNYKTLGGKKFDDVMRMMGIEPKPGNLTASDIKNAQRWIQKNIGPIRSAVIPMHSTTKMVSVSKVDPLTGKTVLDEGGKVVKELVSRPDKAVGIPQVLLDALFTKNTRKDNLTKWMFNDTMLDAEILSVFGITEKGQPNLQSKETNVSSRVRALVKLVDMAMTNQGARVAMDQRGDPLSEVLHIADGRSLNLYSQDVDPLGGGISDMMRYQDISEFQDEIMLAAEIAMEHGYSSPSSDNKEFTTAANEAGISQAALDYLEAIDFKKYHAVGEQGLKKPLLAKLNSGDFQGEAKALMNSFFLNKIEKETTVARKQLENGTISLVNSMPPSVVKALGKQFFGMVGSTRGLSKPLNIKAYEAFEARIAQVGTDQDMSIEELGFNPADIKPINAGTGIALDIQKIQADPSLDAAGKEAKVNSLYGTKQADGTKVLDLSANKKALAYILDKMSSIKDPAARLGVLRLFETGSNNTLSIRALTSLDAIQYTNESLARYIGTHKKTGKVTHFPSNPTAAQKKIYSVELNTGHPNYNAAVAYGKKKALEKSKTNPSKKFPQGNKRKGWGPKKIAAEAAKITEDALKFKGEHVSPSANVQRQMVEVLMNSWYGNGNIAIETEMLINDFGQTLGAKVFSDTQDSKLGSTSPADQLRMIAIKNEPGIDIDQFKGTRSGLAYSQIVRQLLTNRQKLQETLTKLSDVKKGDPSKNAELRSRLSSVLSPSATDAEAKKVQADIRKANSNKMSQDVEPKGMSAWDFDDTLATTKSGVRVKVPNPDGSPKPGRKVIFMAGGAGSGKGNVISKLGLEKAGYKIVNSDISLEWLKKNNGLPADQSDYTSEQRSELSKLTWEARKIAKRKQGKFSGNGDGVVVDGTGGSVNVMGKQVQEFKDKGYDVSMIFVETSLEVAQQRNAARSERSLREGILNKNHAQVQGNKEAFKAMFEENFNEISTDNVGLNDALPSSFKEGVDNFTNSYENRRIDAEEFAKDGADLKAKGGTFDFTEFNKVVDGEAGPLLGKALKRAKRFGTEDTYILTARSPESAPAIKEFLDAMGLDIPIENITGLGNSTGEAKAAWLLDKYAAGYNDIYFADDAKQNVDVVRETLNKNDVKNKVELAEKFSFDTERDLTWNLEEQIVNQLDTETRRYVKGGKPQKKFKADFSVGKNDFSVTLTNRPLSFREGYIQDDSIFELEFTLKDDLGEFGAFGKTGIENLEKGVGQKVLSVVTNGVLDFVKANNVNAIGFSSYETSRTRIYNTLTKFWAKKMGWQWDSEIYNPSGNNKYQQGAFVVSNPEAGKMLDPEDGTDGKEVDSPYFGPNGVVDPTQAVVAENDIKGKGKRAKQKFSQDVESTIMDILSAGQSELDLQFNTVLSETMGVDPRKEFSAVKARQRGKNKGNFKLFLPPSAEDFKGLMYSFMGKGEQGEKHQKFFKEHLFDPFSKGMRRLNSVQHEVTSDIRGIKKAIPKIKSKLTSKVVDTNFTNEQAVRVYNWNKNGVEVPGLSRTDQAALVKAVNEDVELKAFAEAVQGVSGKIDVDSNPGRAWLAGTVSSDLNDQMNSSRGSYLQEWSDNAGVMFSEKNLNKIEAVYGTNFREALEDSLYRMKSGSKRPAGQSKLMNNFNNWINGSVGTTMFLNARSAMLQMISNVNFINWHDNNPIKAAKAFANPKQYWGDVAMIFNSPYLKQRRSGIGTDLNAAELMQDMRDSSNPMKTVTAHLLQLGFTPTQVADSLAIATGGATMYRNRINSLMEKGMTKAEAENQAFLDMQEIAEETQQSARADKISQQQASPLGKLILAFQNTPMQYNRIMKRAMQDMANGRGDVKEHVSKIIYYGGVQSMIFYGLQTALFSSLFGDDDEDDIERKQTRVVNGMIDSILRGAGITGAVVATAKNTILEFMEQDAENDDGVFYTDPNHAYTVIEALNLSPPIGIKARKLYGATQTWQFNRDVISHMSKTDMDNPIYDASFSATEAVTNVPLSRLYNKVQNIKEALNEDNETWQRVAMLLGWSKWSFGIKNQDVMTARGEVKEIKKEAAKEKAEMKKVAKEVEKQAQDEIVEESNLLEQEEEREEGQKDIKCAAVSRSGSRCGKTVKDGGNYCTIHEGAVQRADGEKKQCSHVKASGKRCKMKTSSKSGKCYYHD